MVLERREESSVAAEMADWSERRAKVRMEGLMEMEMESFWDSKQEMGYGVDWQMEWTLLGFREEEEVLEEEEEVAVRMVEKMRREVRRYERRRRRGESMDGEEKRGSIYVRRDLLYSLYNVGFIMGEGGG